MKRIDNDAFKTMLNVLTNIITEQILVKPRMFKKMYKHRKVFRKLIDPRLKDLEVKKKILTNQRGGILPIFAALIPLFAAAAPFIAKAGLGIGTAAASAAAAAAVAKKINGS